MKSFIFMCSLLLLVCKNNYSQSLILGVKNTRIAIAGYELSCKLGLLIENTMYVQDVKSQYIRLALFYKKDLQYKVNAGLFAFYGQRYNHDYYDLGVRLFTDWHWKVFAFSGALQPLYDSEMKYHTCYSVAVNGYVFSDFAVAIEFKNIPEYRNVEKRASFGLLFDTPVLKVKPEVSIPLTNEEQLTRISISLLYNHKFRSKLQ